MMKKGTSYVDWAISFGLFIVFISIIFSIFKPGVIEDYNSNNLVSIVKNGMNDDVYLTLNRTPIFLDVSNSVLPGLHGIELNNFPKPLDENMFITYLDGTPITEFKILNQQLTFDAYITTEPDLNIFYLFRNSHFPYTEGTPNLIEINDGDFSYAIGVTEKIKGISPERFNLLPSYDELKTKWNFPYSEDFSISIYPSLDLSNPIYEYAPLSPNQERVELIRFSDFILNLDSTKQPVTVIIRVW